MLKSSNLKNKIISSSVYSLIIVLHFHSHSKMSLHKFWMFHFAYNNQLNVKYFVQKITLNFWCIQLIESINFSNVLFSLVDLLLSSACKFKKNISRNNYFMTQNDILLLKNKSILKWKWKKNKFQQLSARRK